jgi:ABC-type oligopeptide transport system substrate-binding subunit
MTAAGIALLGAAGFAPPSAATTAPATKSGGTLNIDWDSDFQYMDPQLSYYQLDWAVLQSTCVKLLNWPDTNGAKAAQLQPEAATGFPKVSNGGRTYDFTVSVPWTKFYPGNQAVTANSFKAAFDRIEDPRMQSPATQFTHDVARYRVQGNHFIVTLRKPAPDFLARIGMEFFCAVPTDLPHTPNGVERPPMAGPYYIASWQRGRSLVMKENPNYKGKRPHNVDTINWTIGNSEEATQLRIESAQTDYGPVPPTSYTSIGKQYGLNKARFFVRPAFQTWYLAFNHDRKLFKQGGPHGNVNLKQAINLALDRHALVIQSGTYSGRRTDQLLPPLMPGFEDANLYPTVKQPNFKRAAALAKGHTGNGKAVLYAFSSRYGPLWAQIIQFNLKQIGLDVEVQQFPREIQVSKMQTRGEPFDLAINGWGADYADPSDFLNVLLDGSRLQSAHNVNISYLNYKDVNAQLARAAALTGPARLMRYGNLDVQLMRDVAPYAPIMNQNGRFYVSARYGCFTYQPVIGVPNLAAACIK